MNVRMCRIMKFLRLIRESCKSQNTSNVSVYVLSLKKNKGWIRQEVWEEGLRGGVQNVGHEVWNIEDDIVKIEYEQLKHNHYQMKGLRRCTHTRGLECAHKGKPTCTLRTSPGKIAERAICQKLHSGMKPWSYLCERTEHTLNAVTCNESTV